MHRILLRTLVIDVPSERHEETRDFWTTALAATHRRGKNYPEYHVLEHAAAGGPVMVQDIGTAPARFHVDIESDDVAAEVGRLVAAGATEVDAHQHPHQHPHQHWVVLRDPAGLLFCVVPGEGEDFLAKATTVSESSGE